jgi:hypothetical protein
MGKNNLFVILAVFVLGGLFGSEVHARKSGFNENLKGITIGGGTYYHWLPNNNLYDPVPSLAPASSTVTGSDTALLIPAKLGYFHSKKDFAIETYIRYMLNSREAWTVSGGASGTGYITYRSYGMGLNLNLPFVKSDGYRIGLVGNAEYILQRAELDFLGSGTHQQIDLSATSILAGTGIEGQLWLADMWSLSVMFAYQYGMPTTWNVSEAGIFMNRNEPVGELKDTNGIAARADFGGFLVEAALKLAFF